MIFIGKKAIQYFGISYVSKVITYVAALIFLINGFEFYTNDFSLKGLITTSAHPNLLSSFFLLCFPFILINHNLSNAKGKIFSVVVFCLLLVAIFTLGSKAALIGLCFFAVVFLGFILSKNKNKLYGYLGILLTLGLLVVFYCYSWGLFVVPHSLAERVFIWNKTLNVIADNFLRLFSKKLAIV